jgi:ribosomal protein L37AE/L43A
LSDDIDAAYEKYLRPHTDVEIEAKITCPKCDSENVDRGAGYRGEYTCFDCGHHWQVGGPNAS